MRPFRVAFFFLELKKDNRSHFGALGARRLASAQPAPNTFYNNGISTIVAKEVRQTNQSPYRGRLYVIMNT